MRKAEIYVNGILAGILQELKDAQAYIFSYVNGYTGPPVSLTLPVRETDYEFTGFPSFFDGLLPEGIQLEGLLRIRKIDRNDFFSQLIAVGEDMVGAVTVKEVL